MNRARSFLWTLFVIAATPALLLASTVAWLLALDSDTWKRGAAYFVLAGLCAILLIVAVMEIRKLAWKWHSPMFYPAIRTFVIGVFAALLVRALLAQPWEDTFPVNCDEHGVCGTASRFNLSILIFVLLVSVFIFGPFLRSVFDLYDAWRNPTHSFHLPAPDTIA